MTDGRDYVEEPQPGLPSSDWVGAAVAEDRMYGDDNDLVGLAGLDPHKWVALGISMYFGLDETADDIFLYVADWDDFKAVDVEAQEPIPVRSIMLHDISVRTVMAHLRGKAFVHLRDRGSIESKLYIVERSDFPDPDDIPDSEVGV
jgi:hypothetical protein